MRIELCGGIASGKTTLATALKARFPNCYTVLENAFFGDFLADFYHDPKYYAYETEIFFLLQHMHQIKVGQRENMQLVCDFSLEQDFSYGENNLEKEELSSFQKVYQMAMRQLREPEMIVFLECPIEILLERITARGQTNEQAISADYLYTTVFNLERRLQKLGRDIVIIDSSQYDFRKDVDISRLFSGPLRRYKPVFERFDSVL